MLVDEVIINVKAGNGGDGKVHFHREKYVSKGGPDGGKGGNGGDVYFTTVSNISALRRFRNQKRFSAEDGKTGGSENKTGSSGKDIVLIAPIGTVLKDIDTGDTWELQKEGDSVCIAKGGHGGRGNWSFRSSTNQVPLEYEPGTPGEERNLLLELRLIADIGFIGLPSVGKSSLLNELAQTSVKVAAYHFTTLEPNLGVMDKLILADLPGLIEGASTGRGLGIKFLKHVRRTKVLVHCISVESVEPMKDYEIVRKELGDYDKELLDKKEIIVLTKTDLVSAEELKSKVKNLKPANAEILLVSIHDYDQLQALKKKLLEISNQN